MMSTPETRDLAVRLPGCNPHLERLRKTNWSHQAGGRGASQLPCPPLAAGPVLAIPPLLRPPDHGDRGAPG